MNFTCNNCYFNFYAGAAAPVQAPLPEAALVPVVEPELAPVPEPEVPEPAPVPEPEVPPPPQEDPLSDSESESESESSSSSDDESEESDDEEEEEEEEKPFPPTKKTKIDEGMKRAEEFREWVENIRNQGVKQAPPPPPHLSEEAFIELQRRELEYWNNKKRLASTVHEIKLPR